MCRVATIVISIVVAMSGLVFSPAHAAVPANGDYVCSTGLIKTTETTNLFTITAGVVSWHTSGFCSGAVVIPAGVTTISEAAFEDDTLLTSISIPASVSSIETAAFSGATALTSISVHADNANYRSTDGVLFNKSSTTLLSYPAGKIGTSYLVSESVVAIEGYAFFMAAALTSITIPASVMSIGRYAFTGATALNGVNFLGNAPAADNTTFLYVPLGARANVKADATGFGVAGANWSGLTVEILTTDGNYVCTTGVLATTETTNLYTVTAGVVRGHVSGSCAGSVLIPAGATSIFHLAFSYDALLTSITIPSSVTSIEEYAFWNAPLLTSITVHANNLSYKTVDGVLFNKASTKLVSYPAGKSATSYAIPTSVTSIGEGAFAYAAALTSVSIPEGVTSIGSYAFSDTTSLASIVIPASVSNVGFAAFFKATSLTSIAIPSGVTSIGGYAFSNATALTSITIPATVTSIGEYAFWKTTSLASITVHSGNANYLSTEGVLFNKASTKLVSHPAGKSATSYAIPTSVTSIGEGAFAYAAALTSVSIPEGLIRIEEYAFSDATSLASINIPSSVTDIGQFALKGATALNRVNFLGNAPTTVGTTPFFNVASGAKAYIRSGDSSFGVSGADWNGLTVEVVVSTPSSGSSSGSDAPASVVGTVKAPATVTSTGVVSAKKKYSAKSLAKRMGVKIVSSNATVYISVAKSSKKVCTESGSMLKTIKAGKCVVTFTVQEPKPKKGKKPKATRTVVELLVQ